jgi:hypothetical protein
MDWKIQGSTLCKEKRLFSSPKCPDKLWGPSSFLLNGYYGFLPFCKSTLGKKLTTHLIKCQVKNRGQIYLF